MINITNSINIRPCKVGERLGLFHGWSTYNFVLLKADRMLRPTVMEKYYNDFRQSGIVPGCMDTKAIPETRAIVEFEDGHVEEVRPTDIRFLDSKGLFAKYAFTDKQENDNNANHN